MRHILPQTTSQLNARITLDIILLALTGLSLLGLGLKAPLLSGA